MRFAYPALAALVLFPAAAALGACGDPFGGVDPQIVSDSVVLASANGPSTRASAVDIADNVRLTFPENPGTAGLFDLQVRQNGTAFSLVPSPSTGNLRGAGLQRTTRTLEAPGDAPREVSGYTRTAVTVAVGETYFVQTRPVCGSSSSRYAILRVVAANPAAGELTLKILSNQNCDDERLEI
ncbi:MAG TPA: hypothetical protein VFJ16_08605 [Longimicrobium sp.]|nr:hypothetical protein [Longimicrobium sp.]